MAKKSLTRGTGNDGRNARSLGTVLRRHLGQSTVLGVAIPILDEYILATEEKRDASGLTERQIGEGFNKLSSQYIHSDYHSTYLARRLGNSGFLDLVDGKFRLRPTLVANLSIKELVQLRHELVESLRTAHEQRQIAIKRLEEVCALPSDKVGERFALVEEYLAQLSGNRGEVFEVVSFAVLREYFRGFGFSLQRFSTTQANDGGMDFFAANAIYQVTTDQSVAKLHRDLKKSPGTKRVLVRPSISKDILDLGEDKILETIELNDLLDHFIAWLMSRDQRSKRPNHLQQILLIALDEFRREDKAEMAESPDELTLEPR